jgi:hypothetical protein
MAGFTTRDFASLLDEALASNGTEEPAAPPRPKIPFDILGRRAADRTATVSDPEAAAEYLFAAADHFSIEPELSQLIEPPSIEPFDIARELRLTGRETPDALDHIRREFAFTNHPDRVSEDLRDRAVIRMQIANRMIDDAKERSAKIARIS